MILLLLRRRSTRVFLMVAPIWIALDVVIGPLIMALVTVPLLNRLNSLDPALGAWLMSLLEVFP